ncbi:Protein transport protein sec39 [Ophiocordyceps camponoti-floridani]|uniref:Protein transport protein sec39 n=1 Tax=Ophiocordyceps camponoti-floridani TaxID=2030778 RepID=A0A8H4Q9K1_9HYPO|nr:Protein transport protein sec39 [Ophiocordyceps camponoti-floridani]
MALVLSALISSRLGVSWTLKRAGDLAFLQDEKEQKVELGKLMRIIPVNAKDDKQSWLRARRELLWLHDWGCPSRALSTPVQPVFASVSKDFIEGEFLKVLLSSSCCTLASTIFENGTDRPLAAGKVQDAVFQSALTAFDNASSLDRSQGGLKKCSEILHALPELASSSLPRRVGWLIGANVGSQYMDK